MPIEILKPDAANIPYHGQQIVAQDAFVRKLPQVVSVKQRLAWDALVMASDIMADAYRRIRNAAIARGLEFDGLEELEIAPSIGCCWTIIDQLHAVRQLMPFLANMNPPLGPLCQAFMEQSASTFEIRNKMDHLSANMGNFSIMTGPRSPLFGSLSYFHISEAENETGHSIVLYSGALIEGTRVPIVNPAEKTFVVPVGLFKFTAFGRDLFLELTLGALLEWISAVAPDIEDQVRNQSHQYAIEHGLNLDELMASARGAFAVAAIIGPAPDESLDHVIGD